MAKAIAIRKRPAAVGPDEIVGLDGVVREGGMVFVRGELWRAQSATPLHPGQRVRIDAIDGLTLAVTPE
jgi:membrane-bound ClpP family serine protease